MNSLIGLPIRWAECVEVSVDSLPGLRATVERLEQRVLRSSPGRGAVLNGTDRAYRWHCGQGGPETGLVVLQFVVGNAYANDDALECAATYAAWKALGHAEADLEVRPSGGIWRVYLRGEFGGDG